MTTKRGERRIFAATPGSDEPLLAVEDFRTHFETPAGIVKAVDGVSFTLQRG